MFIELIDKTFILNRYAARSLRVNAQGKAKSVIHMFIGEPKILVPVNDEKVNEDFFDRFSQLRPFKTNGLRDSGCDCI